MPHSHARPCSCPSAARSLSPSSSALGACPRGRLIRCALVSRHGRTRICSPDRFRCPACRLNGTYTAQRGGRVTAPTLRKESSSLLTPPVVQADAMRRVALALEPMAGGMSYKTILVHCDANPRLSQRLAVAVDLAQRYGAHLVGARSTRPPSTRCARCGMAASVTCRW
jgi:hypothetical protein